MRWRDRILGWLRLRPRVATHPSHPARGSVDHVVILDGTLSSLENGEETNAGRLYRILGEAAADHRLNLRYEAGIQWYSWRNSLDVIEGRGINRQIRRVYGHIASRYRPGDRIFLFGYSRGAYAVRSLAGLIDRVGLLTPEHATERNVRLAYRYYQRGGTSPMQPVFRRRNCHDDVRIEMIGAWDTVKALGLRLPVIWRWTEKPHLFHDHSLGPYIRHGFHALAMDETRRVFEPVMWHTGNGYPGTVEQMWFRGTHGDIGGQLSGFEAARPLANIPLVWMLERAEACGLPLPEDWKTRFPCDPDAPSVGTWRGWGKVFVARRPRIICADPSESVHPTARSGPPAADVAAMMSFTQASNGNHPMKSPMTWIDMPPVWLIAALIAARGLGHLVPLPAFGPWALWAGPGLVLLGLVLITVAAIQFHRAQTSIIPHQEPRALIATGIYRYSRNPIYLGDALILAGAILYWQAMWPLVLLPIFTGIIRARFIGPEEARLSHAFPAEFSAYARRTRRWL